MLHTLHTYNRKNKLSHEGGGWSGAGPVKRRTDGVWVCMCCSTTGVGREGVKRAGQKKDATTLRKEKKKEKECNSRRRWKHVAVMLSLFMVTVLPYPTCYTKKQFIIMLHWHVCM